MYNHCYEIKLFFIRCFMLSRTPADLILDWNIFYQNVGAKGSGYEIKLFFITGSNPSFEYRNLGV